MSARLAWVDALAARVERAFDRFQKALDAPVSLLSHRSSPERWSALGVGEHVALTNRFLAMLLGKIADKCRSRVERGAACNEAAPDFEALEKISRGDFAWTAPTHMLPSGRATQAEVQSELAAQRERILGMLREFPHGEGRLYTIRMSVIGPDSRVDLYELVCFIALHLERHERQLLRALDEARAALRD